MATMNNAATIVSFHSLCSDISKHMNCNLFFIFLITFCNSLLGTAIAHLSVGVFFTCDSEASVQFYESDREKYSCNLSLLTYFVIFMIDFDFLKVI